MSKPSAIVQRFKFNTHSQQPGETIAMFLAELRQLTEYCEFGVTLDEILRDRLVCGVQDIRIQRRLLAEPKLTLQRAFDLALAIEAAEKDASEIQKWDSQEGATPLNKVDTKDGRGSEINCYRCGKNKKSDTPQGTQLLADEVTTPGGERGTSAYSLFTLGSKRPAPYKVQLSVDGQTLEMEIDTGLLFQLSVRKPTTTWFQSTAPPPLPH